MADLNEVADHVLEGVAADEQVEVVVVRSRDTEVRVFEGEIESMSVAESFGVGVRSVWNGRQGFASAGTFDPDVVRSTHVEAKDNAAYAAPDEFLGLPDPDGVPEPDLDVVDPTFDDLSTEAKIDLATELEAAVLAGDARIIGIETAEYADSRVESVIANSAGVRAESAETTCDLVAYALAAEGDETQTGFGFSVGRGPGDLDVAAAADDAVHRATRLLGATQPPTERVTVVLDPFVTAQFLAIVGSTLSGEAVLKGRSPFAERVGEPVAADCVTFVDDPTDARAFTATATDGEGLATRRNTLIDAGVLTGFVHDSYSARRAGVTPTGSAVRGYSTTPPPAARPSAWPRARRPRRSCSPKSATGSWWPTCRGCTRASTRCRATSRRAPTACASATVGWPSPFARSPSRRPSRRCSRTSPPWVPISPGCPWPPRARAWLSPTSRCPERERTRAGRHRPAHRRAVRAG